MKIRVTYAIELDNEFTQTMNEPGAILKLYPELADNPIVKEALATTHLQEVVKNALTTVHLQEVVQSIEEVYPMVTSVELVGMKEIPKVVNRTGHTRVEVTCVIALSIEFIQPALVVVFLEDTADFLEMLPMVHRVTVKEARDVIEGLTAEEESELVETLERSFGITAQTQTQTQTQAQAQTQTQAQTEDEPKEGDNIGNEPEKGGS